MALAKTKDDERITYRCITSPKVNDVSYYVVKRLIDTNSLYNVFSKINVPGDGHCFMYALLCSIECQLGQISTDIHHLKNAIILELYKNIECYIPFIPDGDKSRFKTELFEYINEKKYDSNLCDLLPYIAANALMVNLIIVDISVRNEVETVNTIAIEHRQSSEETKYVSIIRKGMHFDALQFRNNIIYPPVISVSQFVSSKCDDKHDALNTNHNNSFQGSTPVIKCSSYQMNETKSYNNSGKAPKLHCPCRITDILSNNNICLCALKNKFKKHKGLKNIHINARSLLPKKDEIHWIIKELNVDACFISETWLDDTVLDVDVSLAGYSCVRKDRHNRRGGGVPLYIKQDLKVSERNDINTDKDLEMIWLEVTTQHGSPNILLSCVYRPPNAHPEYFDTIVDTTEKAVSENKEVIIIGDLNIDYSIKENLNSNSIFLMESLFGMNQLILSPTRVTLTSSSILDDILTTCPQHHVISGVHKINLSDHYMIYTCINITPNHRPHREIKYRKVPDIEPPNE